MIGELNRKNVKHHESVPMSVGEGKLIVTTDRFILIPPDGYPFVSLTRVQAIRLARRVLKFLADSENETSAPERAASEQRAQRRLRAKLRKGHKDG